MSREIEITGKYNCKKISPHGKCVEINTKNNITKYGALQLARFLDKKITFSKKELSNTFGSTIGYNNETKKISIKNGSTLATIGQSNNNLYLGGSNNVKNSINSDPSNYTTYITENLSGEVDIEIYFPKSINLKKIGLLSRFNFGDSSNNSYPSTIMQNVYVDLKTEGYHINDSGLSENDKYYNTYGGDFLRCYNLDTPLYNNKPYYIRKTKSSLSSREYVRLYLFYDGQKWVIFNRLPNTGETITPFLNSSTTNGYPDSASWSSSTISSYIDNWYEPCYRLYDPMVRQNLVALTNSEINFSDDTNLNPSGTWQNKPMCWDFSHINYNDYNINSSDYSGNKIYQSFSFESLETKVDMYGIGEEFIESRGEYENLFGFAPNIKAIRLRTKPISYSTYSKLIFDIFSIDIFEAVLTPYNPCKIALSTNENGFTEANSWIVDNIEIKGDDTVIFSKTLDYEEGVTIGSIEYDKIGLFGNFSGTFNSSEPTNIKITNDQEIIEENCFSKATFETSWIKTNDEQVIISYELKIN